MDTGTETKGASPLERSGKNTGDWPGETRVVFYVMRGFPKASVEAWVRVRVWASAAKTPISSGFAACGSLQNASRSPFIASVVIFLGDMVLVGIAVLLTFFEEVAPTPRCNKQLPRRPHLGAPLAPRQAKTRDIGGRDGVGGPIWSILRTESWGAADCRE